MAMYNEITVTAELTNTEYMITKNYNLLENKPQINSVELIGNKSLEDLGINPDAEENVIDVVKVNGSALTPDADKAVNVTVTTGSDNGTVKVNGSDVAVKGLKSAAFTEATAYDAAGSAAEVHGEVEALTVVVNGKVDKVQGKGLSQNDFTNAYKSKLDGIEAGAQVNTVTSVAGKTGAVTLQKSNVGLGNVDNTSDLNKPISTATQTALNGKVDKETGKGLSTNDYTTADKTKLAGIEAEANKTIVDSAISGTSTNPVQNKVIYDFINNLLPEATASGNPISIDDASGFNAKSATVTMLPIQSGSGDPSPTNIRPISGRNGLVLVDSGKNLIDIVPANVLKQNGSFTPIYSENNTVTIPATQILALYLIFSAIIIEPSMVGKSISISGNKSISQHTSIVLMAKANDTYTERASNYVITNDDVGLTFGIRVYNASGQNCTFSNIQFEFSNTATDFEPFKGLTTHTATFPSTVYGGEYEFVSGEDSIKFAIKTLTGAEGINWSLSGTQTLYRDSALLPYIRVGTSRIYGVCSACPSIEASTGELYINNSYMDKPSASSKGIEFNQVIDFWGLEEATSTALNAKLAELYAAGTPVEICYELATPTTTTLTPQSIELNKGTNVLSTDGDNIELKYSVSLDSLVNSSNSTRTLNLTKSVNTEEKIDEIIKK